MPYGQKRIGLIFHQADELNLKNNFMIIKYLKLYALELHKFNFYLYNNTRKYILYIYSI